LQRGGEREALVHYVCREIFNTDQGSQFTSVLLNNEVAISMDDKHMARQRLFDGLRHSLKYVEVHLKAFDSVSEARASIGRYLTFYNNRRPRSSLDWRTPDQAYFDPLPQLAAA